MKPLKLRIPLSACVTLQLSLFPVMRIHDTGLAGKACKFLYVLFALGVGSLKLDNQQPFTCGNIRNPGAEIHC